MVRKEERHQHRRTGLGYSLAIFALLACLLWTSSAEAASHRALLIGIGDYSAATLIPPPEELRTDLARQRSWQPLLGPVNDVNAIQEILVQRYGFRESEIKVLVDQQATRNAILEALKQELVEKAEPGDQVLFYFAGHGSQIKNSLSDEPDRLDETLVPADAPLGWPDLRDKELRPFFNKILDQGAYLTVILDSCHSGSATRGLLEDLVARSVLPEFRDSPMLPFGPRPDERGALILAAAQDHEKAYELPKPGGKTYGVFSWALLKSMGELGEGASVQDLLEATRARMHGDRGARQEPLLLTRRGDEQAPLFGRSTIPGKNRRRLAAERTLRDGSVVVTGGWADRLTVGSELQSADRATVQARLRVEEVLGPTTSRTSIMTENPGSAPTIPPGTLFDLAIYGVPPNGPLNVWIPQAYQTPEAIARFASDLKVLADARGVAWVEDPTETAPTHVLRSRDGFWELRSHLGGAAKVVGTEPTAKEVFDRLESREPPRLFLQLPVPEEISRWLELGAGTRNSSIQPVPEPAEADYMLVGRWKKGQVSYAWVHPGAAVQSEYSPQGTIPLPSRTDWMEWPGQSATVARLAVVGEALETSALGLANLQAWLELGSPSPFGYSLAFRPEGGERGELQRGELLEEHHYTIVLRRQERVTARQVSPRYVYIFAIDSHGKSALLFPVSRTENRYPLTLLEGEVVPQEIDLGSESRFVLTPPLGTETFFLLASVEPLPNPWVLQFEGVTTRATSEASPLEELLSRTGISQRAVQSAVVPATWSLSRITLRSVPPLP